MKTADWKKPLPLPSGKFSANVTPFKFGDSRHVQIFGRLNVKGNSRNARVKTHRDSRGVIWNGLPFYWSTKGHYRGGAIGQRKPLHWLVWERANGRCVPAQPRHVVVFLDGNKHNFAPANLALRSRGQIAVANQAVMTIEERRQWTKKRWANISDTERSRLKMNEWTKRSRSLVTSLLGARQNLTKLKL